MSGVRDLYFACAKNAVEAMAGLNWRRIDVPGENLGVDFYLDPEIAIDMARHMSRLDMSEPAWAVHVAISSDAYAKWRASDAMAERIGDDAGSLFVSAEHFAELSNDLIEPIEVMGAFA
jgi:hypothetical protein